MSQYLNKLSQREQTIEFELSSKEKALLEFCKLKVQTIKEKLNSLYKYGNGI